MFVFKFKHISKTTASVGAALLTISVASAFDSSMVKSAPVVTDVTSKQQMSIDPTLVNALDPKSREITSLKKELEELKKVLKQTQASIGVPIKDASHQGIPAVPASVVTKNVPTYKANAKNSQQYDAARGNNNNITVTPGVNQIVTISLGHANRIVTPFSRPEIGGVSGNGISIKNNVVYVTATTTNPISMFITEKGNENIAISLTLLPRKIPSREVRLSLNTSNFDMSYGSKEAEIWEKSQPFVSGIADTLSETALQNIPRGYQLSDIPRRYKIPVCSAEGFNVDFSKGQLLMGSKLHYVIGKVTNVSAHPLEFKESSCGDYDIAGVSLWPDNILEPGQSSEIYVVRHAAGKVESKQQRRSVLTR